MQRPRLCIASRGKNKRTTKTEDSRLLQVVNIDWGFFVVVTEGIVNKGTVAFSASWQPGVCFMGSKCEGNIFWSWDRKKVV